MMDKHDASVINGWVLEFRFYLEWLSVFFILWLSLLPYGFVDVRFWAMVVKHCCFLQVVKPWVVASVWWLSVELLLPPNGWNLSYGFCLIVKRWIVTFNEWLKLELWFLLHFFFDCTTYFKLKKRQSAFPACEGLLRI